MLRSVTKNIIDFLRISEALPIFGVPLVVAVERSHCHDGVLLPLVVRNCIDHVQDCGKSIFTFNTAVSQWGNNCLPLDICDCLCCAIFRAGLLVEGVYKLSGIKSKVQQLKRSYNQREAVRLSDFDLPIITSLLKTFFRFVFEVWSIVEWRGVTEPMFSQGTAWTCCYVRIASSLWRRGKHQRTSYSGTRIGRLGFGATPRKQDGVGVDYPAFGNRRCSCKRTFPDAFRRSSPSKTEWVKWATIGHTSLNNSCIIK